MFTMNLPKPYWGDAILAAAYLINRMPLKALNLKSPLAILKGHSDYIVPPKVFGCVCFVHTRNTGKLDPKALKCVFIGYSPTQKGYKCYHPPSKKYFVSMDVTFREHEPYFTTTGSPLQGENNEREEVINSPMTLDDLNSEESSSGEGLQKETIGRLDRPDLKRYSRRNMSEKATEEAIMKSTICQEPSSSGELSLNSDL
ncbi:hypothetical protein JGD54_25530, partial [Salmonella enterica subsp. enterica serovar Typhimurium]|nr:hypothetical protein [Salmonella enterica subsp. enterica serovar Typhimurium]